MAGGRAAGGGGAYGGGSYGGGTLLRSNEKENATEWRGVGGGALGRNFFNSSGPRYICHVYLLVNRQMYGPYVHRLRLRSSVLKSRNILHLYSSVSRNIKIPRNV
jgi:hypothetical protein